MEPIPFAEELERRDARRAQALAAIERLQAEITRASRGRGVAGLEHSALVREREMLAREASEPLPSVLGEPLTATSVAGIRGKLERALRES